MSIRTWVKPLGITLVVSGAVGAAQLGIAYGLTILLWARDFTGSEDRAWAANLTWVCWLSAASVVLGVVISRRVTHHADLPRSVITQLARVGSAAAGALVTVPLAALPARYAGSAGDAAPVSTVARVALVGVLLGALVSVGVLLGRPLEWNTLTTTGVLWILALGSVLVSLGRPDPSEAVRLAVWSHAQRPGWFGVVIPMLGATLVIGAALAFLAKRQGCSRVEVAVCGAPGPLVVAVAYLVAGPGVRPETGDQLLPYLAAPYAVLTGLLGSLLVSAIEWPAGDDDPESSEPDQPTQETPPRDDVSRETPGEDTTTVTVPTPRASVTESVAVSVDPPARTSEESSDQDPSQVDEDEQWLRQLRGDDRSGVARRPAAEPKRSRRRKWSLFSEDDATEATTAGDAATAGSAGE